MPILNFEGILQETGWGIYNKFVIFICGTCVFVSTLALTTLTFVLPFPIYFRQFSESNMLWMFASMPLGAVFGNILFGLFSDILSRKCVLTSTLVISFISCFSLGFASDLTMYIAFSFILGCINSVNILTAKVFLSEILPLQRRGFYIIFVDMMTILGYLISSCINWIFLGRTGNIYPDQEESWRIAMGLPTCACLFVIGFSGLLQPTPRELLSKNAIGAAHLVVKYMFALNTSNHSENFKINVTDLRGLIEAKSLNIYRGNKCSEYLVRMFANIFKIIKTIVNRNIRCLCLVSLIRCSLSAGCTFTNIWLTKSLNKNLTSCTVESKDVLHLVTMSSQEPRSIEWLIPANFFFEYFLNGSAMFIGLFFFSYIIDKIGRRVPLMVALLFSGVVIINFPLYDLYTMRLGFSMAYMMSFSIANAALDVIMIENHPTAIRTISLVLSYTPSLILSVLSRLIISMDCTHFFYLIGGSTIIASGFCYFLPDLKNLPMVE